MFALNLSFDSVPVSLMCWFEMVFRCGVLTVEIEHVDVATLEKLEKQGVDCQPKASTLRIIQVLCWHIGDIFACRVN